MVAAGASIFQMISINECIEFLAAHGASKRSVAIVLDIPFETFSDICQAMPDVQWKPKGQTLGDLRSSRKRQYAAKKRKTMLEEAEKFSLTSEATIYGHSGTISELADKFATVTKRTIIHRLKLGYSIEDAILKPRERGPVRHAN